MDVMSSALATDDDPRCSKPQCNTTLYWLVTATCKHPATVSGSAFHSVCDYCMCVRVYILLSGSFVDPEAFLYSFLLSGI